MLTLFKWSTPERRNVDRVLPIIPNEIYLDIFEHIAPSAGNLTLEQLRIFTNLSCVCRFFANFCLPRIFESVEFSGSIFRDDTPNRLRNDAIYKTSRESTLCAQITAKQPLALALAQRVKICRFTNWKLDSDGAWAVRIFARKYLAGIVHMKNIGQLTFSDSFVGREHWDAITTLPSLQELSFDGCSFLGGPADVEPEKRVVLKVSRLQVTRCTGYRQPLSAVDPRSLRTLVVDFEVDWLSQSAVRELRICPSQLSCLVDDRRLERMRTMLMEAPPSIEILWISIDVAPGTAGVNTLDVLTLTLDAIRHLPNLQSLTLGGNQLHRQIPIAEVRRMLGDEVGPASSLRYVDLYGKVLRFVDGEWSEVSCNTA